jgi:Binding-prot-dependent transport system membrane comp, N-term
MLTYIVRRIGYGVLILLGVNLATFFLFFTVNTPDDMARLNIGGKRVTQEQITKWKVERGYEKPLYWNGGRQGSEQLTETIFWGARSRSSSSISGAPIRKARATSGTRWPPAWWRACNSRCRSSCSR